MTTDPADHDRELARALAELPVPEAPPTLLPRVMAAVHARAERPWYSRAWLTWPRGWQVASVVIFVSCIAGVAVSWPTMQAAMAGFSPRAVASGAFASLWHGASAVSQFTDAAQVAGRVLAEIAGPFARYLLALVVLMTTAGSLLVVALDRVALGGARQS